MFYFTISLKKKNYWVFYKPHTEIVLILAAQHTLKYYVSIR